MLRLATLFSLLLLFPQVAINSIARGTVVQSAPDAPPASNETPPSDGSSASSAPPMSVVTLVTGEILRGSIVESNAGEIVLAHPLLGRLAVPRSAIASIVEAPPTTPPIPGDAPATTASTAPAGAAAAPPAKVAVPRRPGWASERVDLLEVDESLPEEGTIDWLANIQGSISGVNSDTNQLDLRAAAALARVSHTDKLSASAELYYSLLDSQTTDSNLLATSVYDYFLLPSDWLLFAKVQYQYDRFQEWENRISAYGGFGYRFFHRKPFALTVKAGAGATREFGDINRTTPEAYGELAFAWWIDRYQTIEGSVNVAPDIGSFGEYRVLARIDWTFRLDSSGLALVGGVREEYQSNVGPGGTPNDFRYYAGLRFQF